MKLKALIVDDEYPARQELRYLLGKFDNIEVVGEAANAQEALELIKALDYSVLFLDIEMPGMNGLELGAAIMDLPRQPCVVFVSAYDEYALKAFDVNAVDYIVKPVEEQRLEKAVEKITRIMQEHTEVTGELGSKGESIKKSQEYDARQLRINRLPAEKKGKTILVSEKEIFFAFTEQDYIYIKTYDEKLFTRFTLKELQARLDPGIFFRTHRCYLVNLKKVKEIIPFFNGTYNLVLDDAEHSEVPVSRAQAKKLRKVLGF